MSKEQQTLLDTAVTLLQEAGLILRDLQNQATLVNSTELNKLRRFKEWFQSGVVRYVRFLGDDDGMNLVLAFSYDQNGDMRVNFNEFPHESLTVKHQQIIEGSFEQLNDAWMFNCTTDDGNDIALYAYQLQSHEPEHEPNPEPILDDDPDARSTDFVPPCDDPVPVERPHGMLRNLVQRARRRDQSETADRA